MEIVNVCNLQNTINYNMINYNILLIEIVSFFRINSPFHYVFLSLCVSFIMCFFLISVIYLLNAGKRYPAGDEVRPDFLV
jgi:hypothetical protein